MADAISANRMEPVIDKTLRSPFWRAARISAKWRLPLDEPPHIKNGGICHTQLLVFQ